MNIENRWAKLVDPNQPEGLRGHTFSDGHDPKQCQHCDDIRRYGLEILEEALWAGKRDRKTQEALRARIASMGVEALR